MPADSVPGVTIPRRRARCHPHWPGSGGRCKLGARDKFMAGVGGWEIPVAGMCDINWLPSLLSGRSSRPRPCLHTLTAYVNRCPSDTFPGRESECEMIVLFTSYLWHCLLSVQQEAQTELYGSTVHLRWCVSLAAVIQDGPVCLLVWRRANSLASTAALLSPGCSSSLPVLMRAVGHWGVFVSFLRQTMQFKPASGM